MGYDWNFSVFTPYLAAFGRGLVVTIELSIISSVAGTIAGFTLGWLLRIRKVGGLLLLFNDCIRAIPMIVLMFGFYYFPYQQLLGIPALDPFVCACAALTLAQVAFTADVVRAAVDGVSQRTILGAKSVGLTERVILWHFVLPDVIRQISPTLIALYIGNIKLSSIAAVIACEEVVFVARLAVSQTFRSLEAWVVVALIYVALVVPLTIAARRFERSEWLLRRT